MEDSTLEQEAVSEERHDSKGSPCQSSPLLGGLHPTEETHAEAAHEGLQPHGKDSLEKSIDAILQQGGL